MWDKGEIMKKFLLLSKLSNQSIRLIYITFNLF